MVKICILGAGVCGLSCALRIKEKYPHYQVIIKSKDFSPNTTGDGSAGLWGPYLIKDTPQEKIHRWGKETFDFFYDLWRQGVGGSCMIPCLWIYSDTSELSKMKDVVFGLKELTKKEIESFGFSNKDKSGYLFTGFTCEPTKLLPYLSEKFQQLGGMIVKEQAKSISDYTNGDFDIVINCTGLGSKDLVSDNNLSAIRGQVARVYAPWMYHVVLDNADDGNYIIPNTNNVVLGGTHQIDDHNIEVDPEDSKFIFNGCQKIVPGLKHSEVEFEWVGLRPGRDSVQLTKEEIISQSGKKVYLIHNYGHGGSGVTLSWGCAGEVLEIIDNLNISKAKSKL